MGLKDRILSGAIFFTFSVVLGCAMGVGRRDNMMEDRETADKDDTAFVEGNLLPIFETKLFATSGLCARCHSNLEDEFGEDVSIDADWRSTMMANSARDPLWQAKVHSEVLRTPHYSEKIQEKCATCHMPMATFQAKVDGKKAIIIGGFLDEKNPYHVLAMDGVSCSLCHQIKNSPRLGTPASFTGGYEIDSTTQKPDRLIFGPYQNPFSRPMRMMDGFTPTYGSHISKSELCATCHTLYTNPVDDNGNLILNENGEPVNFPEQTPYLEWLHSVFGDGVGGDDKTCQDCHMPKAKGKVKIANRPPRIPTRSPFSKHYFVGGNVFMLTILKNNIKELGLTASSEHFQRTIKRTLELLQNETAVLKIQNVVRE